MKYFSSVVIVFAAAIAYADTPDLTDSLEFIANPQMDRWPNSALPRACLDLQFYQGRLFNGGGEVESNPGAPWISSIDPYDNSTKFEFDPGTEAIANYRIASWGDLLTPSQDPHEGDANLGHVFTRSPEGVWSVFKSVGGSTKTSTSGTVANNTHCWDMEEFDGRIFVSCYNLLSSTDRCKTFTVCSPITDAYHRISFKASYISKGKEVIYDSYSSTLRRQMQLMRFDNELFAVGNTIVQPQWMSDAGANNQELYRYDASTKRFVETTQRASDIYPNLTTNDYKLVGRNLAYLATNRYARVWARIWHTTPFKGRVLYVGCYDTPPYSSVSKPYEDSIALTSYPLPLMGCSATVTSGKVKATRISFGNDKTNYPWDFAVAGDTVYALTSRYVADGKKNHHIVWKSTDGVNFSEVFSFDYHQNFISLEYRDGWFYLGVGYKAATKGYAYDSTADESGAIYRVRCPQEPIQVVPSVDTLELAEGASTTVSFRLSAQPSSNVTLRVGAALKNTRFTTDKSTLTFTTSDWNTPKSVTVSVDDNDVLDQNRSGAVVCGVAGFDVARGEFCGGEVTAGVINLTLGDSEFAPPANGEIRNADDFYCAMAFPDGAYKMMNDIDLTDSLFTTVPEFSGTLDGCGYTLSGLGDGPLATLNRGVIKNLTLDGTVGGKATEVKGIARGIFFDKMSGGAFTNCVLKGYTLKAGAPDTILGLWVAALTGPCEFVGCSTAADCTLSQSGSHDCSLGGFAGKIEIAGSDGVLAAFIDCTNNAAIAASDNYRTASGAGGFVGYVTGSASANQPEIRFVRSVNNGAITGKDRYSVLGGFAGRFNASNSNKSSTLADFSDCVNNASISHTGNGKSSGAAGGLAGIIGNAANAVFDRCVNRGDVIGPAQLSAGGLVGEFGNPSPVGENGIRIVNSANYGDIAATNNVGGLIGKTTGSTGTGWKNGHWMFLNSANYGSLATTTVTVNGELAASVSCEATAATASITVSNCWTVTDRLFATTSRQPVCGGNYTAATAAATAAAALDAVAAKEEAYLSWAVGPTGNPELTEEQSVIPPDDPPYIPDVPGDDEPGGDRTADLEYVCTPAKLRWPNVPSACRAFDLEVYHDRVYVGSGDYDSNAGPCYMLAVDPYYLVCSNEFAAGTEATETIRTFSDGRLYVPATDHMDTGSYPNGFWFRKELDGTWGSHRGIPGGVTGYLNVHNWDMQEFDGWIFSGGYGIAGSSDWGEKWTDVAPKATLARGYTVYSAIMNGKPYDNTLLTLSSKYEYRFTAFLTVGDEFYCLPKNRYYFDQGYPKMPDGRTVSEWNPPTIWHWDKEKHVFNCESNSWENIAPGLQLEDFILVSSTAIPQEILVSGGSNYKVLDTWHATKFKDRCLYVISSTYRPIAAMCAYLDAGELRASRISLPAGTWPRDFTVFGDAAYLLAVAYDSENQSVRHTVWKSTDGIAFTEIFNFDFQQPMESIEYHEGYFYFGVGPKGALPNLGTLKSGITELSGGIYRIWLPQEPVAVVAAASTVQVQEGGSASVSLRLSAAPSATVEVTGSVLGTDLLSVEKKTLVFTPQNWNVPQTLNVSLPENGVSEPDAVKAVFGVATNGTRGAFASVEATPCVVTAVPVGNERAPVLTDESFDTDHLPVSYTVSVSDFGLLNGVSPTSATVILSAYAEGSADPAVVAEKTVTTLNTPVTVAIDGIVKGAKYRFVAEVRTSSSVGTSSSVTARAPIGTAEELVDLTDDLSNYASKFGVNCHSGGADGSGAWDGTSSGYGKTFGGYSKPSCAIWEFVTPTVVNGMGLLSQISESGDPDRNPSKFGLYGANDTNNWVELVVCANEPQWAVGGEWRRVSFDNTTAYKFYKVALMGAQGPNSPWVVAQEAELYHLGGQPYVPPEMTYRFYHEELNIPAMHAKGITGRGVRVGVVDDGIYPVVIGGVTNLGFAALKGSPAAGYHGTSVSALIGSKEFGLAPDCEIWAYNSGNATGKTGLDQTIAGVWWCATNGCRVINMSFGFAPDMYDADLRAAFDAELAEIQRQTGVILINGNGNNPLSDINYCPQDSECVITIGGLKPDKTPAALTDSWRKDFCTFGDQVPDFVKPDGTIGTFDGTSCACPLATAIVALLLQQQPDLTQDEVYGILKSSAKVLAPGRTREYGWGLLQACEVPANYKRQAEYDAEKQAWVKLENITITNKFVTYTASDNFYEITMRTGSVIRLMLSDPMPANATDKTVYWYCGNNHAGKPILTDQILRAPDEIATVTEITINGQTIKLPTPNLENVYSYQGLNANYELLFNLRVRLTTDPVEIPENEDPNYVPADPERPERTDWSYYHESLNVPAMHAKGVTGKGVRVGIVDGPINEVTVDGEKNLTIARLAGSGHGNGHGLSVASIIASKKFGIAPDCELYAYDVGNSTASDQVNKVLKGLWWCATNGCKVINMSFSFNPFQPGVAELRESFDAEIKKICDQTGVILIASLGNNGLNDNPYFPQDTAYPICIGGITQDKQPTDLTKSWRHDFCAYGKQVPTFTKADGTVDNQDGTSFSAPMATGVAALLLQQVPTLTRDELYGILKGSAEVLAEGLTREYGWGLVRACEVPSDYKRQSEYDAEKSVKVRLAGITINNQNGFYNPENGFFDMTVKVGTVVKIDYTPSPANATDKRAYWYAGNTQKLDPILADNILRARDDASLVGSFATYTAMNDDYEELLKLRVFFTDQDVGPEPEEPEEPVDPPSGDQSVVYVATTGSDSASGTFDAPLLTISNAVARLGASGGTVMVGPGEYKIYDPIVIKTPVTVIGSGCDGAATILRNGSTYNYHVMSDVKKPNCRVLEISNQVAVVCGLVVENGITGISSGANGGGGVLLESGTVSNCVIRGCGSILASSPLPLGGGVCVCGPDALLTHCVVSNCYSKNDANWSGANASGVHVAGGKVANTLVSGCYSSVEVPAYVRTVGGIMLTDGTAENCTVVNCWGSKAGGIYASPESKKTVRVVNCVAFGCEKRLKDSEGVLQTTSSNSDGTESCFVNCSFAATAADFADYANGDYRPAAGGALVDAGAAIAAAPAGDLDGCPRVVGTAIDIGCFEWQDGGVVELEAPVLSGSSFGFSGTGKFSIAVENPVRGAYYTVFTTEDLRGTFIAESASVLCDGEALVLEMDASAPQKFAKVVVSSSPFVKGFELP